MACIDGNATGIFGTEKNRCVESPLAKEKKCIDGISIEEEEVRATRCEAAV